MFKFVIVASSEIKISFLMQYLSFTSGLFMSNVLTNVVTFDIIREIVEEV